MMEMEINNGLEEIHGELIGVKMDNSE